MIKQSVKETSANLMKTSNNFSSADGNNLINPSQIYSFQKTGQRLLPERVPER